MIRGQLNYDGSRKLRRRLAAYSNALCRKQDPKYRCGSNRARLFILTESDTATRTRSSPSQAKLTAKRSNKTAKLRSASRVLTKGDA